MDKREVICQATISLVISEGIHNTPMSKIAREAGVSVGTIYLYFKDKKDLISSVFMDTKKAMGKAIQEIEYKKQDAESVFKAIWKGLYHFFLQNPTGFLYIEHLKNSTYISAELHKEAEQYYAPIVHFFAEAVKTKKVKSFDIEILLAMQYAVISQLVNLEIAGLLKISSRQLNKVCQACWDGIKR